MKIKKYIAAWTLLGLLLGWHFFAKQAGIDSQLQPEPKSITKSNPLEKIREDALIEPIPALPHDDLADERVVAKSALVGLQKIAKYSSHYFHDDVLAQVFAEFQKSPRYIAMFKAVLVDPKKAQEFFGEDAPLARYYGLRYFGFLARAQEFGPITEVVHNLNTQRLKGESYNEQMAIDFKDAINIYVQSIEPDIWYHDLASNLARIGNMSEMDDELRELIDDEIYSYLYPIYGHEKAAEFLEVELGPRA